MILIFSMYNYIPTITIVFDSLYVLLHVQKTNANLLSSFLLSLMRLNVNSLIVHILCVGCKYMNKQKKKN